MSKKSSYVWMYTILPISAISGGLAVIIPLLILFLKGTVYDVGIATALYALISIPASIFWGDMTDKIKKTKLFIIISIIGTFPILFIFYIINYVPAVYSTYGVDAFVATAASPAINILIMSKRQKSSLPGYFSRYSALVIIGSLIGMIPGLFINSRLIKLYLILLFFVNLLALIAAILLINSDNKPEKEKHKKTVKRSFSILNMLSVTPYILSGYQLIERLLKGLKDRYERDIYLLLATISMFNLGLYLFNTSYIPYLYKYGISYGGIFTINISNEIAQLVIYTVVLSLVRCMPLGRYYKLSTAIRGIAYIVAAVPLFFFSWLFFPINIFAYFIAGIAYALWNITSSVMLYEKIRNRRPGHYVGLWVAILGLSGVIGSFVSGLVSKIYGYLVTFIFSVVVVVISLAIFVYLEKHSRNQTGTNIRKTSHLMLY